MATAKEDRKISGQHPMINEISVEHEGDDKAKKSNSGELLRDDPVNDFTMDSDEYLAMKQFISAKESPLERRALMSLEKQLELEVPESQYDLKVINQFHLCFGYINISLLDNDNVGSASGTLHPGSSAWCRGM